MEFIHSREYLNQGDTVVLDCDTQCNFMLMDDSAFSRFKAGDGGFSYFGGHFERFPAAIKVPHLGQWNITIDLGGGQANVRYSLRTIKAEGVPGD